MKLQISAIILCLSFTYVFSISETFGKKVQQLIKCGFSPDSIIDVGANEGDWSLAMLKHFPKSQFFMIEGNSIHSNKLNSTNIPYVISLVGDSVKKVKFYVGGGAGTGSSIYSENTNFNFEVKEETIYPIDSLLHKYNVPSPQFIKLDIQGAELLALKGAKKALKSVEVIFTEAPVHNYNEGAPSFYHLYGFLRRSGFELYDIFDLANLVNNTLVQFDAIFVKSNSKLWEQSCTGYPAPKHTLSHTTIGTTD